MQQSAKVAVMPRYRRLTADEVMTKAADDLVTIADRESEAILAEGLSRLVPEASVVGEEAVHRDPRLTDRLGDGLCWIIDPLDGTNNFVAGRPPFGILVALAQAGETIAGWIYDPVSGRCCHAERGRGAFVDGERVWSLGSRQTKPVVAISMALVDPKHTTRIKALLEPNCSIVDIPRCAAEQYPRIALGQNDIALVNRTLPWDHAAGVLFLNEAGAKAAHHDGTCYRPDSAKTGLLIASTPPLWDWMTQLMQEA
jgi:fructose-1,6-bisphosphatase/inositol monophosphatase family enzyme